MGPKKKFNFPFSISYFFFVSDIFKDKKNNHKSKVLQYSNYLCREYLFRRGKTPLVIEIAKELEILGKKSAIIKKFYPDHFDEHSLIRKPSEKSFLDKSRIKAISKADSNSFDFLILDDGFQDHFLKKT